MLRDVIVALATFVTAAGGLELVKWLSTRKSAKRKARAEADTAGIEARDTALGVMERTNTFLSKQVEELTKQVYENSKEILSLKEEISDLKLREQMYHCEVRGCASRVPPNGY